MLPKRCIRKAVMLLSLLSLLSIGLHTLYTPGLSAMTQGEGEADAPLFVLILSYMRAGSSLTGELFNYNNNAIYFFEPLHSVDFATQHLRYPNGSKGDFPQMENQAELGLDVIGNILRCQTERIFQNVLDMNDFMRRGRKTSTYTTCAQSEKSVCLARLRSLCRSSVIRVIKTIRLRLYDVRRLLNAFPSLKIIHLLRDPRGIVNSRNRFSVTKGNDARILCNEMEDDLVTADLFAKLYRNRVLRVLYEDLAENPYVTGERMYKFLGEKLPDDVRSWVGDATASTKRNKIYGYSTLRRNSSRTAVKWRSEIPWSLTRYMDRHCSGVYDRLGFNYFFSEKALRNLSLPHREHDRT